jgi:ribosomal protein L35AE/L33A
MAEELVINVLQSNKEDRQVNTSYIGYAVCYQESVQGFVITTKIIDASWTGSSVKTKICAQASSKLQEAYQSNIKLFLYSDS